MSIKKTIIYILVGSAVSFVSYSLGKRAANKKIKTIGALHIYGDELYLRSDIPVEEVKTLNYAVMCVKQTQ